jgi:hypothetical protein
MFCFSDEFLQYINAYQTVQGQNHARLSTIELLNSSLQQEWFLATVRGHWKVSWSPTFQMILTKWGFCFSFNLMPLDELFDLEKYFS